MTISALGDSAVVVTLGERVDAGMARRVRAIVAELEHRRPPGVDDVVGAFASVAVFYDRARSTDFETLRAALEKAVASADESAVNVASRDVEIPVCYGGEFGPDLDAVATHTRLSPAEVIAMHSGGDYLVHAIGFAPGFPYLGGLAPALATPRRATPRPQVAAGSVGIGGTQTGIYPLASPGGWNLIGRTPLALFDAARAEPSLLRAGDRVKFRAIDRAAHDAQATAVQAKRPASERHQNGTTAAAIDVLRAGMLTTVQDLGRPGHRAQGVPLGGAADSMALRVANLLVGNAETAAALEFTLVGPELRFRADTMVALGGGDFGLPRWQPLRMRAGDTLKFGAARHGCRGYLAVAGGIDVQPVLGSGSTYLRAGLGGWEGRALHDGDVLPRVGIAREFRGHWHIDERILPAYSHSPTVRVVAGVHAPQFRTDWTATAFTVTPRSDRMGMRLAGEPLRREQEVDLVSSPVAPGTVQVPPDGQPIVLLADAQTIGGYPQLAHVISVDLPLVAQLRPGDTVRFERVTLEEAHALLLARERALGMLREGVAQKLA